MNDQLADILDTCLAWLEGGTSVEDCLAAYPQYQSELEAPLRAAVQVRALPHPALPAATRASLEAQLLALAAARRMAQAPTSAANNSRLASLPSWRTLDPSAVLAGMLRALGYRGPLSRPLLRLASLAIALVLALVIGAGAYAAARALVRTIIPEPRATPTATILPAETFNLDGPIEQIGPQEWVVSGIPIGIDTQTTIIGTPAVGATAQVSGVFQPDGGLRAQHIVVESPAGTPVPTVAPSPVVIPTNTPLPPPTATPAPPPPPPGNDDDDDDDGDD